MQKNYKENNLKPYAIKSINSKGRIYNEKENSIRSPYQRDRDRIIHSSSFRRLKHKTQVFANTEGDHYRTRLTHSMEVSQISRTLARSLGLNEDLCETLSLSHDLGHTPFGHAGEVVLDQCMKRHGGFDHNIQTLRIVTLLENKYYKFFGLNLTIETLDGLIKHNGPVKNQKPYNTIFKKRLTKPIGVARLRFFSSEESGLMTVSLIDCDQAVNEWHSYSAYDTSILDDNLLGK